MSENLLDVLAERGLVAQMTDADLRKRLASPVTLYAGFDPTADSLHVGNLVPIMVLAWAQRLGHRPLALVGGATGLVGDPSGKSDSRKMLTPDVINQNAQAIGAQIGRVMRFGTGPTDAVLVNNADWLGSLGWIELLRTVGPQFSVNRMLSMDSVKARLETGITFLEFNYMVMQAYDFWHLAKTHGCTLQVGGQEQWGNIVMGIELARRKDDLDLAGLTMPLITKADGKKFGKSESGNVWLDAGRTPPYEFYQFWRNVADSDVSRFLGYFTWLPMVEIRALCAPGADINAAKVRLAFEVTSLIHGQAAAEEARDSASKAFGAGHDVTGDAIPHAPLSAAELASGLGLLALLVRAGLCASNGEGKRLIQGGGVRLHDDKITDPGHQVTSADVRAGMLVLRAGKKQMFRFDVA